MQYDTCYILSNQNILTNLCLYSHLSVHVVTVSAKYSLASRFPYIFCGTCFSWIWRTACKMKQNRLRSYLILKRYGLLRFVPHAVSCWCNSCIALCFCLPVHPFSISMGENDRSHLQTSPSERQPRLIQAPQRCPIVRWTTPPSQRPLLS